MNKKSIAVLLAVLLVVGIAIGGTMAWLSDKTEDIINTFTVGDVNITLDEDGAEFVSGGVGDKAQEFQMIPGWAIEKKPEVTVLAGSEDCWLFVKAEKSVNFDQFMAFGVTTGEDSWIQGDGPEIPANVYYRKVLKSGNDQQFYVLTDNKVTVLDTVTKEMMNGLNQSSYPTLTFTAYAIQLKQSNEKEFAPADAWAAVQPTN